MSTRAEAKRLAVVNGIPEDPPPNTNVAPAQPSVALSAPPFPVPDETMFFGLPGEAVNALDPYTEACRPAVLVSLLSGCGAMIGRGPHVLAGFVRHPASIWGMLVGGTALGAKGTADAAAQMILRNIDPAFMATRLLPSLSTGEGLIHQVRDASEKTDKDNVPLDEGVNDKRLYVVVPEFRTVIAQARRDNSTLAPVLRSAWDSVDILSMPNRGDNGYRATGAHIVMMAHVTPGEFRKKMDPAEIAGGTLNRYLIIASRESKDLPQQAEVPPETIRDLSKRFREQIDDAKSLRDKQIARTAAAEELWVEKYRELKNPTGARTEDEEGIIASVVTRARPHVLRLALTYSLLDGRQIIDEPHLRAALALWQYSLDSAHWLFRGYGVNPDLVKLRAFIDSSPQGRSREDITNGCFSRRAPKSMPLDDLLTMLGGDYEECSISTGGRPKKVYQRKAAENAEEAG